MTSFSVLLVGALAVLQHVSAAPATGACPKGDVVFIIDKSGSIGVDWPLQMDALKTIVGDFPVGPSAYQFGAVSFDYGSYAEFHLDTYDSSEAVKTAIDNIVYTSGSTNIAAGFREARHMFEKPGNRPLITDIAILFTDGISNVEGNRIEIEVALLKADGVLVITVGISSAHDQVALSKYATDPRWYFSSPGYEELAGILNDVTDSVCEAVDTPSTICEMCNDFDTENYGYLAHDECYKYYLCRHDVTSGSVDLFATMKCGPGTVFNSASAKEGKPCVAVSEENPNCPRENDVIPPYEGPCLYVPDPYGEGEFGILDGEHFTKAGTCGGGYWDVELCTCIGMLTDCRCRLMVDFEGDVQDHSCQRGWISNNNPQVTLVSDGIFGGGGHFTGLTETYQNGAHLLAWSLNGAFNPCEHGGQDKLTVATWMKYSGGSGAKGLVNYCGEEGPSFYLSLDADTGRVTGGIETYEGVTQTVSSTSTVNKDEWYYVSMVYDSANISLYVTRRANFLTCAVSSTASYCLPEDVKPQTGCVKSKNCGVQIGASGKSWQDDEFFQGHIDDVQIFFGADYMACRG